MCDFTGSVDMLFTVDPALFGETADPSISAVSMDVYIYFSGLGFFFTFLHIDICACSCLALYFCHVSFRRCMLHVQYGMF